jgi:Flp pilus assembly protein TadG
MFNRTRKRSARAAAGSLRPRSSRVSRGQSTVEFAMVSVLGLVLMMVGVQFALIGQVALSLSQGASALARYAAVNPGSFGTDNGTASLPSAASALLSPTINDSKLTVTVASYKGGTTTTTSSPSATVDRVVVSLSYDASNKIALPNPFLAIPGIFPGITFPTALGAQDEQLYEKNGP